MTTTLKIVICGFVMVFAMTSAEARNRLREAQVESLPAPQIDAPAYSHGLTPPQGLPTRAGASLPSQKLSIQRMSAQKLPAFSMPMQRGIALAKGVREPCIRYVQHRPLKASCCGCQSSLTAVVTVEDPRTCCRIDVPVTLPGCCQGLPSMHRRKGILMRGVTGFQWACGYRVRVIVDRHGDVVVHYLGG